MSVRFDPKIETIMNTLHARRFKLKGIKNGIRVKLNDGVDVDIYTLKRQPEHVRARLKTDIADDISRELAIDAIFDQVSAGLKDAAVLDEFRFAREADGVYHYYARITMADDEGEVPTLVLDLDDAPSEWAGSELEEVEADSEDVDILRSAIFDTEGVDFERAVELLESIDAKTFRRALDGLGLARSSILRVVLTRLFRSTVSAEDLKEAVKEEALRISDPVDQVELQKIQGENTIEYLQPLIDALLDDDVDRLELE